LRIYSSRSIHKRCSRFMSQIEEHSASEMGMSGHVHLFDHETGGAYSPNFTGPSEALWRTTPNRWPHAVHVPFGTADRAGFRETITRLCARLSRQAPSRDCAVGQFRRM